MIIDSSGQDTISGGDGADMFKGGDWMQGGATHILDFDPPEDVLVYNYVAATSDTPVPVVTITYAEDVTETDGKAYVSVDGWFQQVDATL